MFLENVNPLTKILHAPTMQLRIVGAASDLHSLPDDLEALLFAIYSSALASLDDEDVLQKFGESKAKLLSVYRHGAQEALANAGLLRTSNVVVRQALALFIVCLSFLFQRIQTYALSSFISLSAVGSFCV